MKKFILMSIFYLLSVNVFAEDIELYVGDSTQRSGERAQVLIIFDTSGSMATEETIREAYDPAISYTGSATKTDTYYSYNSVPKENAKTKLDYSDNGCASSYSALAAVGKYNGKVMRLAKQNKNYSWKTLQSSKADLVYIDCLEDVTSGNTGNASGAPGGFPSTKDSSGYSNNTDDTPSFNNAITLYTGNYINWYWHAAVLEKRTRMEIAKEAVSNLIESAPSVSFGLEVFNYNYGTSTSGGRITYGIKDEDTYNRQDIVNRIKDDLFASGNTPLCESMYEASLYLGGKTAKFGNLDTNHKPKKDVSVTSSSNINQYLSPYSGCSNEIFIILMTDGVPVGDTDADKFIDPLVTGESGNRLDELAEWMHTSDINTNLTGRQYATTFTIGFGSGAAGAADLLTDTAEKGGGKYYNANNVDDLVNSLQSALLEILNVSTSFTSPSVASNNFDRTETLDSVYYAMFLPAEGPRWQGNIKKLKVLGDVQYDRDDLPAITDQGAISEDAKTFWSTSPDPDGGTVTEGGVAEMLSKKTNRVLYSDIGTGGSLEVLTRTSAESYYSSKTDFASKLSVDEEVVYDYFDWALGIDIDDVDEDNNTTETRADVFGDPLHSKPLIINYGGATSDSQDVRIVVGTNAGALHMFKDEGATVDESWAFMPKEFFINIADLRDNSDSRRKIYGVDGAATSFIYDKNGDGRISEVDGDKAYVFFGLRRGGSSYYALDVTNPDVKPRLLWHIDANSFGFSELGQSWSQPNIGYSHFNISNGSPAPVLVFGGGYDENKDNLNVGTADTKGRAVFMVDATTGALTWSLTPSANSANNTHFVGEDSIPAKVGILDSDSDGYLDRLYFGDTGGNLWRVDLPYDLTQSGDASIIKLAELGGGVNSEDRRFFSEPSIVRTFFTNTQQTETTVDGIIETSFTRQKRAYDAILLGSGDRSTPTNTDTNDLFFMIKDENVLTQLFTEPGDYVAATVSDLYNITSSPFDSFSDIDDTLRKKEEVDLSSKSGWYHDFAGTGEKNTSAAIVIDGVVYFTGFTPANDDNVANTCQLSEGAGTLYAIGLEYGTTIYDWRTRSISSGIPDTPSIIITRDPIEPVDSCTGDDCDIDDPSGSHNGGDDDGDGFTTVGTLKLISGNIIPLGINMRTSRTYMYITE